MHTLTKEEKEKLIKKKACFNYGIPGHFANKCRKPKKAHGMASQGQRQQIATAIHIYILDKSSNENELEIDDELPERYKKERVQERQRRRFNLMRLVQSAQEEYIQAPVDTHEDAHRMLLRSKQSHEVWKQSPVVLPEDQIPEDSSESTDYEDSSLIELFHTQLAFQDDDKEAISLEDLDREKETPPNNRKENIKIAAAI